MPKEYISRQTLREIFCEWCNAEYENEPCEPSDCPIRRIIREAPAADVVEVVHGEWIEHEGYSECNRCHTKAIYSHKYCPNCGAKMDGERRE